MKVVRCQNEIEDDGTICQECRDKLNGLSEVINGSERQAIIGKMLDESS